MQLMFCAFPGSAVRDPAAKQNAYAETADPRVWDAEDVSVLRTDHISIKAMLHGARKVP
jgi:hypothetical protein